MVGPDFNSHITSTGPSRKAGAAMNRYETVSHPETTSVAGKRFHFIGAGGTGMSGLAKLLIKNKAIIAGSDQQASKVTEALCGLGAEIKIGHNPANLKPATDAVVVSAAVKQQNPEFLAARRRGIKIYKYAQMLGELSRKYETIAVAGTHGKSTVAGWLIYCLKKVGADANFTIGARIKQLNDSSGTAASPYFVAEACEYDRSFLNFHPRTGCILNIEQDHLDYYRNEEEIVEAFCKFAGNIRRNGALVANGQDPNLTAVINTLRDDIRLITFGLDSTCSFYAENFRRINNLQKFDIYRDGKFFHQAAIALPGRHNILNSLAVISATSAAGLPLQDIIEVLPDFSGLDRRLMLKEKTGGVTVVDDYAHHPTEIKASLEALRQQYRPKRLWCVFQPHQYSRTRFLLDDFAKSFTLADVTIVPQIYFVRDTIESKQRINADILVSAIRGSGAKAFFIDGFDNISNFLKENVENGDLVVTMGAGDIWKVSDEYIQWLRTNNSD